MEIISQRSLTLGLRLGAVWYEGKFGGLGGKEERWECDLFLSLPISQGRAFWRNLRGRRRSDSEMETNTKSCGLLWTLTT